MEGFRKEMALRGFGNLKEAELEEDSLFIRWENPCLHLILIGLAQGLFELASGREGDVAWELADDGDLTVKVTS